MTAEKKRSNGPLWALIAITVLPFAAAWVVYLNPSLMEAIQKSNRGELVTPPRPLPALTLNTLDGDPFDSRELEGNWTLLTVAGSSCDQDCALNLYHLRQIRLAMGEDRRRILRVLVLEDTRALDQLRPKLDAFEGTVVVTGPEADRDLLLDTLSTGDRITATNRVYLIDPQGKLMMAYPPTPQAKDVVKDLERLLRVVQL